jgi:hypothetical protein
MTDNKRRDELSANYQISKKDFCGVSIEAHEAFCAGYDQGMADAREAAEKLANALEKIGSNAHFDMEGADMPEFKYYSDTWAECSKALEEYRKKVKE